MTLLTNSFPTSRNLNSRLCVGRCAGVEKDPALIIYHISSLNRPDETRRESTWRGVPRSPTPIVCWDDLLYGAGMGRNDWAVCRLKVDDGVVGGGGCSADQVHKPRDDRFGAVHSLVV